MILADDPLVTALPQLCDTSTLLTQVARWLTHVEACSSSTAAFLERSFRRWRDFSTVKGTMHRVVSVRTVRHRCSSAGLPTPREWHKLLGFLVMLLDAQMGDDLDEAALEEWCDERVGVPYSTVRGAVGWEAVVAAWLGLRSA